MKTKLLPFVLLLISFSAIAQSSLEVKGYFGVSGSTVARKVELTGASSVEMNSLMELGLLLSKNVGGNFRVTTGINYSFGEVDFSPMICPNCSMDLLYVHNYDFKMISVPVYGEYHFWNYLYLAAGPLLDFQRSKDNNFSDQSGLGYLIGLGGKYDANNFSFSIFPNYKRHGAIPFDDSAQYKHILQELGLQFGVGYRF
ncbi:outer membrane beta-barrel protein [Algoriphagus machipongonensis]|uniref:Outer membrane insertion C- signal n=1 Tax=Algoriphagus machipongonensis TaxID=388413 RepID=A3HZ80_9BACT|nr:outer membrane beta-barrel protein [Algoriphagus machipongonensis]EAZ80566.1 putative outer membrane insertion C- signal [Algoriphagus machipongonensis]